MRAQARQRSTFAIALVALTLAIAMLPTSMLRWTRDLSDLLRIPVTPLSHVGTRLTSWIRTADAEEEVPGDPQQRAEHARAERDAFRRLYDEQRLRADEFASRLQELEDLPEGAYRSPRPPLTITVDTTGLNPGEVSSLVELKRGGEAADRVQVGDVVVSGSDVVGRVSRVGPFRLDMMPVTNNATGLVWAAIRPADATSATGRTSIAIQVLGDSRGVMRAHVDGREEVAVGDLVVLNDPSWPESGRGLVLGTIDSMAPLDEAPLRSELIIIPRRRARDHAFVVVLGTGEGESR
ncbi:MAG: hypothetical protein QGH76_04355 [Phycisphaerales bacterium]|jgi:hypothetical protein|nr:hypothetical protein [Phycisphaerales bacterium]